MKGTVVLLNLIQNAIVVVVDVDSVVNIVAVGVECFAEVVINVQRIGVGSAFINIFVGISQSELAQYVNIFIVDIKAIVDVAAFDRVLQAVAIGVSRRINRCLLYTSPSPRDLSTSRMPSSA